MSNKSNFGKNNFDRLEAAGLVASADDGTEQQRAKAEQRLASLRDLGTKLKNVRAGAQELHTLSKQNQMRRLNTVHAAIKKIMGSTLPVGTKKYLVHCSNELVSLREGVFTGAASDRNSLALIACDAAIDEVEKMQLAVTARLERAISASPSSVDQDEYYENVERVIKRHAPESDKLAPINNKPYVIARVPVVPTGTMVSVEKLILNGFTADSLSSYPVIHDQIVIGINASHTGTVRNSAKRDASHDAVFARADELRRKIAKTKNEKVLFVSDKSVKYKTGAWFWLMTERDLKRFAKAFPQGSVSVKEWGFAFN